MNEFLASMYQTRESIGAPSHDASDVEKLAEAQLLDEYLSAEGIDIDRLPGQTILKLAHDLLGDNSALVKAAAEEGESEEHEESESSEHEAGEEEETKEAFETKLAEADFLGRVMAHSYWQEKTAIEKNAGVKETAGKAWEAVRGAANKAGSKTKKFFTSPGETYRYLKGTEGYSRAQALKGTLGSHKKQVGAAAATLGAGGGGAAYAASGGKGKKKKASAIDMLAEQRAMEWAQAHGLLQDSAEEKLASAVNQRAYEMLKQAGIDVEAVEAGE